MPWNLLTSSDILDELSPQEQAALNAIQGNTTTQDSIVQRVVGEIRGHILGGGNQLDADGTIPDQLRNSAIDLCSGAG